MGFCLLKLKVNVPEPPAFVVSVCSCSDWLVVLENVEDVELLLKPCVVGVVVVEADVKTGLGVHFGFEVDGAVNNKKETH